ncbi:MAG: hypothetical protein FJY17_04780 [Bacteroidetes bacterium]|nr:hypothetical protein [Bacteroidota bacterium]
MSGNISQFLADIRERGIAKTSHFDVRLTPPVVISGGGSTGIAPLLTLRCDTAELPGRQIGATDNRIYGPIYKTPFDSSYAEITLTFIDTAKMDIRLFFENWMNQIFDSETNEINYIDNVVSSIFVTQYDVSGSGVTESLNKILEFTLFRAFPTNLNSLTTSWSDDAPHKLAVAFFYEYYTIEAYEPQSLATVNDFIDDTVQEGQGRKEERIAQIERELPGYEEDPPRFSPAKQAINEGGPNSGPKQEGVGRVIVRDALIEQELPGYQNKNQATQPVNPRHLLPVKNVDEATEIAKDVQESRSDAGAPFAGPPDPEHQEEIQSIKQKTEEGRGDTDVSIYSGAD